MKTVNEQLAEMQKKTLESLEPMQNMNSVAAEAFERIARKNYDLMGDLVEYAVAQVKLPAAGTNLQEVFEKRVADTRAFADKVNERAAEYVALAGELGELAQSKTAPSADAKPAKAAAKAPVKSTEEAVATTTEAVEESVGEASEVKHKAPAARKKSAPRKATAKSR